ncbi:2Fe-2S iron-sulfur cluster-binding protein [Engelhardtia mirabilis]|uniref:2Fe-2S ferredoxin n=1 Tax=Engelhardtia mirabilis TaxID=2528011 RepID=A0A518BHW6_9BACT|nr:2Fe-2S ferredoxin [Planctomycetes bacterium Pla133]QDV00870.1 2Fe-2S ferredoxin [Planctomycetes bacterium Pla86]
MGGSNPFIRQAETRLPTRSYRMTFMPEGKVVEVDPSKLPYSRDGLPGSVLEIAGGNGVDIDHACGGVCACSTCHVIIREGLESCNEASDDEEDQLDHAPGLTTESRLACQTVPDGSCDVVVEIPGWNRNLVSEDHH